MSVPKKTSQRDFPEYNWNIYILMTLAFDSCLERSLFKILVLLLLLINRTKYTLQSVIICQLTGIQKLLVTPTSASQCNRQYRSIWSPKEASRQTINFHFTEQIYNSLVLFF